MGASNRTITDFMSNRDIDFMINLPLYSSGSYRVSAYRTHGYKTRRMAIDNGIPLITDTKCAKLFIHVRLQTAVANKKIKNFVKYLFLNFLGA